MRSKAKKMTVNESIMLFFEHVKEELYGTRERAMNTVGVAFLVLVLLRISGIIGETAPIYGAACGS